MLRRLGLESLLTGSSYSFFYKNIMYQLQFEEDISDTLVFLDHSLSDIAPIILETIREAFAFYGRYGDGDKEESVEVEFVELGENHE